MNPLRVVIAGGGTGGHLYPGIAVAREIVRVQPDAVVTFAGTARGIDHDGFYHFRIIPAVPCLSRRLCLAAAFEVVPLGPSL